MEQVGLNLLQAMPGYFWLLVHAGPAAWSVYHALLYKRDPRSATGWIMACLFVPFAGPIAYFLFGINRVRMRARGLRRPFYVVDYEAGTRTVTAPPCGGGANGIEIAGERITGNPAIAGNTVIPLHHGDAAYPAMLDAIHHAQHRVLLSTYIMKHDGIGAEFADALEAALRRGVETNVLIDGFGEMYSLPWISRLLRKRGITVARFLPPRLLPPSIYINLRNHRKILVLDEDVAFVGGMNISADNVLGATGTRAISDIHFRISGPSVSQLARVFFDDWAFATGTVLMPLQASEFGGSGAATCRVVPDGPNSDLDALALTIQAAIGSASRSIDIMTPYFLPDRDLVAALLAASLRGVRLRIVLPAKNNLWYVHWANRNVLAELLQWNAEVYYQPPPFCHSKLLCIDDEYTLIGSANLDARSLRLNFEIGLEVFSADVSRDLRKHFEAVIAGASRVTPNELAARSVPVRLRDSAAALLSPYL
jgi:cardiolipin synthase A/B